MIIIVEGPDGAGKTTAVNELLKQYNDAKVYHYGKPDANANQFGWYYSPISEAMNKPDRLLILDRCWYSEFVYGPAMRGRTLITRAESEALDVLVKWHGGGHVLYLTAPVDVLWQRCNARGESYIKSKSKLAEIVNMYDAIMVNVAKLPVFKVITG